MFIAAVVGFLSACGETGTPLAEAPSLGEANPLLVVSSESADILLMESNAVVQANVLGLNEIAAETNAPAEVAPSEVTPDTLISIATAAGIDEPEANAASTPMAASEQQPEPQSEPQPVSEQQPEPEPPEPVTEQQPQPDSSTEQVFLESEPQFFNTDDNESRRIPNYLSTESGDVEGVSLTRISDNEVFGASNGDARHRYSRRQAWSADESRMDVGDKVLDGQTYEIMANFIPMSTERNWSSVNGELMYGIIYDPQPNVFASWNARTDEMTTYHVFSEYDRCTIGDGEGALSRDDRYVALVCSGGSRGQREVVSYDIVNDRILGRVATESDYNWASVSVSGRYIVIENNKSGGSREELIRYDLDMTNPFKLTDDRHHGDMGVDDNGDDVFVMISWDYISYIRLSDGALVRLGVTDPKGPIAGHGHISCRAHQRPGWCYLTSNEEGHVGSVKIGIAENNPIGSTYNGLPIFQGVSEFELWGFHRSSGSSYDAQAKGSVSPSGTKVVITSDFYGRGEINDYVIELTQ